MLIWPVTGLICYFGTLFLFKKQLVGKISGLTSAGRDGVHFETRLQEADPHQVTSSSYEELMSQPMSSTVLECEKSISASLSRTQLDSDVKRMAFLKRWLAITTTERNYYRIAHLIYGSQVRLLIQLAGTANGLAYDKAQEVFNQALREFPALHGERKLEDWLAYLHTTHLVADLNDRIDITQYGKDFLAYLVEARLSYDRYG